VPGPVPSCPPTRQVCVVVHLTWSFGRNVDSHPGNICCEELVCRPKVGRQESAANMSITQVPITAPFGDDFLAERSLRSASAGGVLLAGLGVGDVISGWPFGIAEGGFGGRLIVFLVDPVAASWTFAALVAFVLYFACYGRQRLVANSPDAELVVLARANELE